MSMLLSLTRCHVFVLVGSAAISGPSETDAQICGIAGCPFDEMSMLSSPFCSRRQILGVPRDLMAKARASA
jgi:hypothetical protein